MSALVIALIVAAVAVAVLYVIDRKYILDEVTKLRNDAAADVAWLQSAIKGGPAVAVQANAPNATASTATQPPVQLSAPGQPAGPAA